MSATLSRRLWRSAQVNTRHGVECVVLAWSVMRALLACVGAGPAPSSCYFDSVGAGEAVRRAAPKVPRAGAPCAPRGGCDDGVCCAHQDTKREAYRETAQGGVIWQTSIGARQLDRSGSGGTSRGPDSGLT